MYTEKKDVTVSKTLTSISSSVVTCDIPSHQKQWLGVPTYKPNIFNRDIIPEEVRPNRYSGSKQPVGHSSKQARITVPPMSWTLLKPTAGRIAILLRETRQTLEHCSPNKAKLRLISNSSGLEGSRSEVGSGIEESTESNEVNRVERFLNGLR